MQHVFLNLEYSFHFSFKGRITFPQKERIARRLFHFRLETQECVLHGRYFAVTTPVSITYGQP